MGNRVGWIDVLLLLGVLVTAFLLLGPVLTIPLHIPLNYNEGWNAYFARRAIGQDPAPLYPRPDSLVFNNYPPLSFYIVGVLGCVLGDMIVAGRTIAMLSLLLSAALVGWCVRLLGGTKRGGLVAAIMLLLYASTYFHDYVAMNDPQWLAHGLMLASLAVLLRKRTVRRFTPTSLVIAALLMAAGGFVKHNLVALPLAITIWLFFVRPSAAGLWLAAASVWVSMGLLLTDLLHGSAAFRDILAHRRLIRIDRAPKALQRLVPLLPMMLVAILATPRRDDIDRPMLLVGIFLTLSIPIGVLQRLGEGVNYNAYFEALIALCLATGLAVSAAKPWPMCGRTIWPSSLILLASIPLLLTMQKNLHRASRDIADRFARAQAWQPLIAQLAASPGEAGCEGLPLCFWAGKPFAIDMFNLDQSILTGGSVTGLDAVLQTDAFRTFEYSAQSFARSSSLQTLAGDPILRKLLEIGYTPSGQWADGSILLAAPASPHRSR